MAVNLEQILSTINSLHIQVSSLTANNLTSIENNIALKELKDRVGRHALDQKEAMSSLSRDFKESRDKQDRVLDKLQEEMGQLKTERNMMVKVVTPIVGLVAGAVSGFFSKHLSP